MPGVSEYQAAGPMRTRRRKVTMLAAAVPSSSLDSQNTVYDTAARKAAVPGSTNNTPTSAQDGLGRVCTRQQKQHNQAADKYRGQSRQSAAEGGCKGQQLRPLGGSKAKIGRQHIAAEDKGIDVCREQSPSQRKQQNGQHDCSQSDITAVKPTKPSIWPHQELRGHQQSHALTVNTTQIGRKTSSLGAKPTAQTNQASATSLPQHKPAQGYNQPLNAQQQSSAPTGTATNRRKRNHPTDGSECTTAGLSPLGTRSEQQASASLPVAQRKRMKNPEHSAAATAAKASTTPAEFSTATAVIGLSTADCLPHPNSLKARFNRLTAEQQISVLAELERLTELEEQCRARLAARKAAAEAKEKEREATRGQERRSARHRKVLQWEGEGFSSRTGTPDPAAAAAAADSKNPTLQAVHPSHYTSAAVLGASAYGSESSGCKVRAEGEAAVVSSIKTPAAGLDNAALSACNISRKRTRVDDSCLFRRTSPEHEVDIMAASNTEALHPGQLINGLQDATAAATESDNENCVNNRPTKVMRLGVRAQARKRSWRHKCDLLDNDDAHAFTKQPMRSHLQ